MLNEALGLVKRYGYAVFPLTPNAKIPLPGSQGWKDGTKDENIVRKYWLNHKSANIGVATGAPSGVVALDIDKGATLEHIRKLFPRTVVAKTKNGYHVLFQYSENVKNGPFKIPSHVLGDLPPCELNIRSTGYYIVGVGSEVDGWEYIWLEDEGGSLAPGDVPYAQVPQWLLEGDSVQPQAQASNLPARSGPVRYGENTRHAAFVKIATAMHARGESEEKILTELRRVNEELCDPPKPFCEDELKNIIKWEVKSGPAPYVLPLGHDQTDYFYTTSSNRQIVRLSRSGHTQWGLLDLMPLEFWLAKYGRENDKGMVTTVDWLRAGSDLMAACREGGIFQQRKIRGVGCWREDEELVIHLGDRIYRRQKYEQLGGMNSKFIYALGPKLPDVASEALEVDECQILLQACECLNWKDPQSAVLFAGGLALLRICGALPWRPMLWLTGPTGSGKTTVLEHVVRNIIGDFGLPILGSSTEAGIRQDLGCDSRPVIFDEAEANNQRTSARMQAILELIRQSSSDSDGRIVKGTPTGGGHSFKINCSFLLSSIRVCLEEEADLNRFCILELERNDPEKWPSVSSSLLKVTSKFGDRLFARMVKQFPILIANKAIFAELIAARSDMRSGQQFGILLAAYYCLRSDKVVEAAEAERLVSALSLKTRQDKQSDCDEIKCLDWLMNSRVTYRDNTLDLTCQEPVSMLVAKARAPGSVALEVLRQYGMDIDHANDRFFIQTEHPELEKIFHGQRWGRHWNRALLRLTGAQKGRPVLAGRQARGVSLPVPLILGGTASQNA